MRLLLLAILMLFGAVPASAQSTFTVQIHNAPGWLHSHTYTYSAGPPTGHFTRVNNGVGWNEGTGEYIPGSAVNNYQLVDPGGPHTCASAASGGPSGTGTGIVDNTCTWNYVGPVDYVSFTGWGIDAGNLWVTGTDYGFLDMTETTDATIPAYQQYSAGCTSTIKPTGTAALLTLADGCVWGYVGKITYSSLSANLHPMERFYYDTLVGTVSGTTLTVTTPPVTWPIIVQQAISFPGMPNSSTGQSDPGVYIASGSGTTWTLSHNVGSYTGKIFISIEGRTANGSNTCCTVVANDFYTANLWNDREYITNTNGEGASFLVYNHNFEYNDAYHDLHAPFPASTSHAEFGYPSVITAATGESFQDTFAANPGLALAGYDSNNGVALLGDVNTGAWDGLTTADNYIRVSRLQIKSTSASAIPLYLRACNGCVLEHNIFEGHPTFFAPAVLGCGGSCAYYDNLVVSHGANGIDLDYGGLVYNNTIVCVDGPSACIGAAVTNTRDWENPVGGLVSGNAMFGFAHAVAQTPISIPPPAMEITWTGDSNATDVSATDGNSYPSVTYSLGSRTSYPMNFAVGQPYCGNWTTTTGQWGDSSAPFIPGTCGIQTSLSPSAVFVTWPGNYRINSSSPLYGGGASWTRIDGGTWAQCGGPTGSGIALCLLNDINTPDVLGTTRPQASTRYDIGAFELLGGGGGVSFGGRFLFR